MEKQCTKCGAFKPQDQFRKERQTVSGYGRVCLECFRSRSNELRRERISTSIVYKCCRGILKRQHTGTPHCDVADSGRYIATMHMLDEFGFVLPEFKGTYEGLIRCPEIVKADRLAAAEALRSEKLEKRAGIRLIPKIAPKTANKPPRHKQKSASEILFIDVEKLLYLRVKYRLKGIARKTGITIPGKLIYLFGRSINEYFVEVFGYSVQELIGKLECMFVDGMSWHRFELGDIHLDHKSPLALFNLADAKELRNAYQLGNLQPLWAADNTKKGAMCDITGCVVYRT